MTFSAPPFGERSKFRKDNRFMLWLMYSRWAEENRDQVNSVEMWPFSKSESCHQVIKSRNEGIQNWTRDLNSNAFFLSIRLSLCGPTVTGFLTVRLFTWGGFSLNCTDLSCWPVKLLIDESSKSQWRWKGIWNAIQNEAESEQTSFMIILLWVACKNRDESTLDRYGDRYKPTFQ